MKFREIFRFGLDYQVRRLSTWLFFAALVVFAFLVVRFVYISDARSVGVALAALALTYGRFQFGHPVLRERWIRRSRTPKAVADAAITMTTKTACCHRRGSDRRRSGRVAAGMARRWAPLLPLHNGCPDWDWVRDLLREVRVN